MAFDRALAGRGIRYTRVHVSVHAKSDTGRPRYRGVARKTVGEGGGGSCRRASRPVRGKAPC